MRLAIIDIGYNAIRAVVYESEKLGAAEIYNDKFRSDLNDLLLRDDLDIKHQTYLSLQYMFRIFEKLQVTLIKIVATAILRNHPKAEEFIEIVKKKFAIDIEILSGEKEARLTALGLIMSTPKASGIMADLGGGSLELAIIQNREIGKLHSFPLGVKVITSKNGDIDLKIISDIISSEFTNTTFENIYLIGGALRLLGKSYMENSRYPLKNLHNFEIDPSSFKIHLAELSHWFASNSELKYSHRLQNNAILVAQSLIEVFSPKKIIVSNYGLKEGVRASILSQEEYAKNLVYERIISIVGRDLEAINLDKFRTIFYNLITSTDDGLSDIIDYCVILANYNKYIDRTLCATFIVEFILSSDIPFSHRERFMISSALATSYSNRSDAYIHRIAKKMLNNRDYYNSLIIGYIIKIAKDIDGPKLFFPSFNLRLKNHGYIEIITSHILPHQVFEKACDKIKHIMVARKNTY